MLKRSSSQRRAQPSRVVNRMRPVANTFDAAARTFDVILATTTPVDRGNFLEVLDVAGADWPESLPLQLDHVLSVENTIGRVENIRVEAGQLVGRARLSQGADLDWLASRIEDGTITSLSVGYRVARWQNRNGERGNKPVRTAVAWTLVEASLVVDPADPAARVRSKGKAMEDEIIETEEAATEAATDSPADGDVALIRRTAEALNLGADVLERDNGDSDDAEAERSAAVARLRQRTAPARRTATRHNAETLDNPSAYRRAMTGAIVARMTGQEPQGASRQLAALEWDEMHRTYARSIGMQTTGLSRADLFTRLLATSDMPQIAGEAVNMNVRREYEAAASPITALLGS
ncbi:MAG: HK97 family phage prohead protease [Hyphomonas sp.]